MRMLMKGAFLICLLVPVAVHGQKRIITLGAGVDLYVVFNKPEPADIPDFAKSKYDCCGAALHLEVGILNRNQALGYRHAQVLFLNEEFDKVSLSYGWGIASSGRYHFASLWIGPAIAVGGGGISPAVHGQGRVYFMPFEMVGFGFVLDGNMPFEFLGLKYLDGNYKSVAFGLYSLTARVRI